MRTLQEYLEQSAERRPTHTAVEEAGGDRALSYGQLAALSDDLRDRLVALGVGIGDRVGTYQPKSEKQVES